VRDLVWLTHQRARVYLGAVLIATIGIVIMLLSHGGYDKEGFPFGRDLGCFWAAARLVWAGFPTAPYNVALERLAQATIYPPGGTEAFFYPPPFLLFCLPLALLPFFWALAAFMAATGAAFAFAVYLTGRSRWIVVAAFGCPAVLVNLVVGQNGMLTAAILGAGVMLMDRRPRLAGLILGAMVIKPQLALALPIVLLLSRRWAVLGFAVLSTCVLLGLSTVLFGWDVWVAFLDSTHDSRAWLEQGSALSINKFQSLFSLARVAGVPVLQAYGVQLLCAVAGVGAYWWAVRRGVSPAVERSLIVLVCLLATPFLWPYDLVALVFPLAWLLVEWSEVGFPPWGKLILLIAYLLPITPMLAIDPGHLSLFGMIGLLVYVLRVRPAGARASNRELPAMELRAVDMAGR
jgi:hypothetical protein